MENESFGDFLVRHYQGFLIGIGTFVALCVLALIGLGISRIQSPKTFLEISVVPGNASIEINGQSYHNGTYEVEPGVYTANISANGFGSVDTSVTVEKGETGQIAAILENEQSGMDYYFTNEGDLNILRSMNDERAKSFIEKYDEQVSIQNYFPIDASYATARGINYSQTISDGSEMPECERVFCLVAQVYQEPNEEIIEQKLANLGYNINDYQIIYEVKK